MLKGLFGSKTRTNILKLFFFNQKKRFYIRELARTVKTSAGNIQKELRKLENEELLKSVIYGNLRLYELNKAHPLFPEMEKIMNKTAGIDVLISKDISDIKGVRFAFIYGSYAKEDLRADSDIDLLIIGDINTDEIIKKLKKTENMISREINFHIINISEFSDKIKTSSFYKDILKKYILLTNNKDEFEKLIGTTGKTGQAKKTTNRVKKYTLKEMMAAVRKFKTRRPDLDVVKWMEING